MEPIEKWNRFMAGDDDAYASLYEEYVQDLYRYGLCFTSDTELVKDCIQDLFVYLYANRSHLEISCQVKTYLLVSLKHNICRSLLRSQKYDSLEEEIPFLAEMSVEDQFIEDESLHNETHQVQKMLSVLTPRQKEIMYYRFVQELPMEDICRLMDLNYQSAQNLIQRSLKKIREAYGDLFLFLCFVYPEKFFIDF